MDYRLDLYNAIKNYTDNASEDDVLMAIAHNKKDGDTYTALIGDWEILSGALTTDGYLKFKEGEDRFEVIRQQIMNIAYNICMTDEKMKNIFKEALI